MKFFTFGVDTKYFVHRIKIILKNDFFWKSIFFITFSNKMQPLSNGPSPTNMIGEWHTVRRFYEIPKTEFEMIKFSYKFFVPLKKGGGSHKND